MAITQSSYTTKQTGNISARLSDAIGGVNGYFRITLRREGEGRLKTRLARRLQAP
jgi:hypothetical protein